MMFNEAMQILSNDTLTLAMWSPGYQEMLVVGIIALLLFGKRLPEVARNLGKGFSEFKKGMSGIEDEFRSASSSHRSVDYSNSSAPSQTTSETEGRPPADDADADADDEFAAPKFEVPAQQSGD